MLRTALNTAADGHSFKVTNIILNSCRVNKGMVNLLISTRTRLRRESFLRSTETAIKRGLSNRECLLNNKSHRQRCCNAASRIIGVS